MSSYVLGISAYYHDSAACLLSSGKLVAAAQEERFSRQKHDSRFPLQAINYCLNEAGICIDDVQHVAFYDKPWLKFERLIETYLMVAPAGIRSFMMAMPLWLKEKLWMGETIRSELGVERELFYPEHHLSHAASAFYPSPFERAAFLTVDGVGEWATSSWGVGAGNHLDLRSEMKFPHSLGLLYSAFTYYTGFRVNSGEYKVMGLAPYGKPLYVQRILDEIIDLRDDGSFRLNMKYFNYCQGLTMTSEAFHRLFGGPPRNPETKITQRDMDLARSIQEVTEEVMVRMARHVRKESGETNLCLAGGCALNCVANGKILREKIFDQIWIQPAAGDAGGALGAAYYVWHDVLNNPRSVTPGKDAQRGSYLGPADSSASISTWLSEKNIPFHVAENEDSLTDRVAALLVDGNVVGWVCGRMEFGPRALGARSILGDPRSPRMQSIMNLKIKHRESFRPFAPSCLAEDAEEYFDIDVESPYMLITAPLQEKYRLDITPQQEQLFGIDLLSVPRSQLPAITHVDYSARIQTVDGQSNPRYYRLLSAFKDRSGFGVLVNTSFNVRGEPIVCTTDDAYRCFMHTEMDVLVLENFILYKTEQPAVPAGTNGRIEYALD